MSGRPGLAGALAVVAALFVAPVAAAQGPVVLAVDGTAADNYDNRWSPPTVTVKAGEAVTWSFAGTTVYHNIVSSGSNWSFRNGNPAIAPDPAAYTFQAPGTYRFLCEIHATTMIGDVIVTDATGAPPPPPPPPPLSEQPWPNDQHAPALDSSRPRLSGLHAAARGRAVRVRFKLSERASVVVRFVRAGITVKRATRTFPPGAGRLTVRDDRMSGRYRVEVRATDLGGNRSPLRTARVVLR